MLLTKISHQCQLFFLTNASECFLVNINTIYLLVDVIEIIYPFRHVRVIYELTIVIFFFLPITINLFLMVGNHYFD